MRQVLKAAALVLAILATACGTALGSSWQAGVAKIVITPDEPIWMAGYAGRTEPAEGKEHDLFAKALALKSPDGSRFVIVTLDLIGITRSIAANVRGRVEKRLDLPAGSLLFNASHTHCGPELRPDRVDLGRFPDDQVPKINKYTTLLEQKIFRVIEKALGSLEPATLTLSQGSAGFARNRRLPTENGFINEQYDDGPTDHDVPVLAVRNAKGELRGILFGYACHNTTLGYQKWCGDYAGFAQANLESNNPGAVAMFVMGAGGDQNPYPRRTLEFCQQHGTALADSVQRSLEGPQEELTGNITTAYDEVTLFFQPLPTMDDLRSQLESSNKYQKAKAKFLLEQLETQRMVDLTYPCPVHVARLGEKLLLVAIGGEVVVDYSRRIKREFAGPTVWFAGYSNDVFGYLPSLRVLEEGGYEGGGAMLYGALPGPFDRTVEDRVMETVSRLVEKVGGSRTSKQ